MHQEREHIFMNLLSDYGFKRIFQESEVGSLAKEDYVEYRNSNMRYWEDQAIVDYATRKSLNEGKAEGIAEGRAEGIAEGKAQGIAEGRAEGIAEGRADEKLSVARNLKNMGFDAETISKATGLSIEEISKLG